MSFHLNYGTQQFELDDRAGRLAQPLSPLAATLADPLQAAQQALAEPLGLPPLAQITVEGDHVAVAIGDHHPLLPSLAAEVVESLLSGPVSADGVALVTPRGDESFAERVREAVAARLPHGLGNRVAVQMHTPADQETMAYLAASKEARPIYLNRTLCEADLVVTLGVARPASTFGYHGVHGGLYPTFADSDAQSRFEAPSNADWPAHRRRRREEAAEAAYLAGILFTVQLVPGLGGGAIDVLAGLAEQVGPAAQHRADEAWSIEPPGAADLVVAAIDGGPGEQTWDNFARALSTARALAAPQGAIAICSEISEAPAGAMRSLAALEGIEKLQRHLQRQRGSDAATALMLAQTLEHVNVFLMSRLADQPLEEIGLAPLHSGEELQRLIDRSESALLLPSAQHLALRPVEPADLAIGK